jgi:hypothetical protein
MQLRLAGPTPHRKDHEGSQHKLKKVNYALLKPVLCNTQLFSRNEAEMAAMREVFRDCVWRKLRQLWRRINWYQRVI